MDMSAHAFTLALRPAVLTRCMGAFLSLVAFAEVPARAAPLQFGANLEQSTWQVQSSRERCVLRHAIPKYGSAEFSRDAGQTLQVRIDLPKSPVEPYQAALRAVPSPWNHHLSARELGTHLTNPSARSFELHGAVAQSLFDALARGQYVELGFGPVGVPAQAVVSLSTVRFLLAAPEFQGCLAGLTVPPPQRASARARVQVASLATAHPGALTAPVASTPQAAEPTDVDSKPDGKAPSAAAAKPVAASDARKAPQKETGAGLELVTEVLLAYGPTQDLLADATRLELGSFAREYRARGSGDLVLIAGSSSEGPQTRRRALEIKGFLVRNGLPAARVLIHVQGEKLPQREGRPVTPPTDTSRMVVWQVR